MTENIRQKNKLQLFSKFCRMQQHTSCMYPVTVVTSLHCHNTDISLVDSHQPDFLLVVGPYNGGLLIRQNTGDCSGKPGECRKVVGDWIWI